MKQLLSTVCLFVYLLLSAAENMGRFDKDSSCWLIDGGSYSCRFFEGNMFPRDFVLESAGPMPRSSFGDNIVTLADKKEWRLDLDRWTKMKILSNTPEEFSAEFEGRFCRDARPKLEVLEEVTAVWRYTFRRGKPGFRVETVLRGKKGGKYRINQTLCFSWRDVFVDKVTLPGKEEMPIVPDKYYDIRQGRITFSGPRFAVTAQASRIIGRVSPAWRAKVLLNAGLWGFDWDGRETACAAEIGFSGKGER